jgi:ketosteroid isomerase-like protein
LGRSARAKAGAHGCDAQRHGRAERAWGDGIPFDGQWASVITVRAGRITRVVGYLTNARAVRALERESGAA